ncbi:hypothetical protein TOPH_06503 [Tolypocladium ophioglossoides CBS 100239]|uniref:Flo11 n=1 Tax=Tolypocladium ophioglossoides (strain CBS 100239) TaxID=1163406 RepID=A0A0L0N4G3_TOLOC|nr:hypothetical protein TOPH_06503 [Tolypocladium ophioglossoides CBS 100239]
MASPTTDSNMSRPTSGVISPRQVRSRSRTQSISSDRPSTIGLSLGLMSPPLSVSPEPAFIAASAASQIVTNDHDSHADTWYDQNGIEPASEAALVSPAALQLVNGFIDQLLFNFLQVSKSTNLSALRPAVSEILKPKLAKDTISNADEELREYLGGGDEDDYVQPPGSSPSRDWDVELVWKRTRLRCMVYSSLGDMEEEDEDLYMEQENLEIGANEQISDVISPAVAIFLTSVLEYMGELTLTVAGQAACHRVRSKIEKGLKDGSRNPADCADRVVVSEMDMERVALDRTLGRLWRGWKKRMRSPGNDLNGRPFSGILTGYQKQDHGTLEAQTAKSVTSDNSIETRKSQDHADNTIAEDVQPMDIPLPIGDNDVDEIEVPGLARNSDDEADEEEEAYEKAKRASRRPKSISITPWVMANGPPTPAPTVSQPHTPVIATRKRSSSLPTPVVSTFHTAKLPQKTAQATSAQADADNEETRSVPSDKDAPVTNENDNAKTKATPKKKVKAATTGTRHSNRPPGSAAAATATAHGRDSDSSEYEDATEVATYEKAEIMTSSRISIAGSSTSSISDYGKASPIKRSSSVQSARIIDVPGPRSPAHSRPTSIDATERPRPVSISGVASLAKAPAAEDERNAKTAEHAAGAPGHVARSSIDKKKSPRQTAAPISESEEGSYSNLTKSSESPETAGPARTISAATSTAEALGSRVKREQPAFGSVGKKPPATSGESAPANIKITTSRNAATLAGPFIEESIPGIPQKTTGHPGWHSPKADGRGMAPMERSRTKETDDELALPLQTNATPRQIHTSASSVSSGTSRLKPVRTSEDNSSRAESVARNFEELIQSNQTITYTLTPENMRDIDSKRPLDSPVVTKFSRKSDDVRGQNSPLSSPTVPDAPKSPLTHQPRSPSSPKAGGRKSGKPVGPIPRAPPGLVLSTGRMGGPQAREARIPGESTADFAEFIKSTGPPGEKGPASLRKGHTSTSPTKSSMDSRRVSPTSNRSRYQPRDAAVDGKGDNSDLIDFIRQGPPIATSSHRIPRHVAPFRTTMDSDQMSGAIGGKAVDATIPEIRYSQASTNLTDNSMPSIQSSVNSSSALLRNKSPTAPSKIFDEEGLMPKRNQKRIRDPYAIDFSDEEDEEEDIVATPKPPVKKEESLAEFLRNYDPPPEPVSAPAPRLPRKKASAPSLIGRFTRSSTREGRDSNVPSGPLRSTKQDSRSLNSRAGAKSGYIPIQVSMPTGYDRYGPIDAPAGRPRMASTASSAARVSMKKFEPREAVSSRSQTADLAAFLRDSVPPESAIGGPPIRDPSRQEESSSFSKMFGRRKKTDLV